MSRLVFTFVRSFCYRGKLRHFTFSQFSDLNPVAAFFSSCSWLPCTRKIQSRFSLLARKMSANNVQALFACSRCFSRHPFEDLSPGQQLCKVCYHHWWFITGCPLIFPTINICISFYDTLRSYNIENYALSRYRRNICMYIMYCDTNQSWCIINREKMKSNTSYFVIGKFIVHPNRILKPRQMIAFIMYKWCVNTAESFGNIIFKARLFLGISDA